MPPPPPSTEALRATELFQTVPAGLVSIPFHRARRSTTIMARVGRLVVIEGLDGAGKRTLTEGLTSRLHAAGATVATLAFPRYGKSVGAADEIRALRAAHDVVLLDRYVASNAAYAAARLREDASGEVVKWVWELEIDRFGLPRPDAQLLLRVSPEVAAERAERRAVAETGRERDAFETDDALQQRCAAVYDELAASNWLSRWYTLDGVAGVDLPALATTIRSRA